jgi:hypothetical protein
MRDETWNELNGDVTNSYSSQIELFSGMSQSSEEIAFDGNLGGCS